MFLSGLETTRQYPLCHYANPNTISFLGLCQNFLGTLLLAILAATKAITMAESETMSIDTSNEAQDDPLQDLSYDKLEELVETTL